MPAKYTRNAKRHPPIDTSPCKHKLNKRNLNEQFDELTSDVHNFQTRTYKHQSTEINPVLTQDVATSMTHQKYPFEPSHPHGIKEDKGNLNPIKRMSPENQFSEWVIDQQCELLQQYAAKKKKND